MLGAAAMHTRRLGLPIAVHVGFNATAREPDESAARDAEAAAAQGRFEAMYDLVLETQPSWGSS